MSGQHGKLPYKSKRKILTDGEKRFYIEGLLPAIGDRYLILMKVRLTDVLEVPAELWKSAAGRKVQQRHVDFLLVAKKSLSIVAVIELDDATHLDKDQKIKDAYLGDALRTASIPLIRFPIYRRYDPPKIRTAIMLALKGSSAKGRCKQSRETIRKKFRPIEPASRD